jgi:hypothetical protein
MSTAPPRPRATDEEQHAAYRASLVAQGVSAADAESIAVRTRFARAMYQFVPPTSEVADSPQGQAKPRLPSKAGIRLIGTSTAIGLDAPAGNDLVFCHSILSQIGLPRSRVDGREFQRRFGAAWLNIQAGWLDEGHGPVMQAVPYGAMPRLALTWISTLALRHRTREINIGRSAAEFLTQLGLDHQGHRYRTLRSQMHALAACRLQMGFQGRTFNSLAVEQFDAWLPRECGTASRWPGLLVLTDGFYAELLKHGVPLDGRALAALKGSALAIDIYTWLAYRLHLISGGPVFIPWQTLMQQFAQDHAGVHALGSFRGSFLHGLHKVQMVYPRAKVVPLRGGLALHFSPPPVARRQVAAASPSRGVRKATS